MLNVASSFGAVLQVGESSIQQTQAQMHRPEKPRENQEESLDKSSEKSIVPPPAAAALYAERNKPNPAPASFIAHKQPQPVAPFKANPEGGPPRGALPPLQGGGLPPLQGAAGGALPPLLGRLPLQPKPSTSTGGFTGEDVEHPPPDLSNLPNPPTGEPGVREPPDHRDKVKEPLPET